jgi:hypothetical protein
LENRVEPVASPSSFRVKVIAAVNYEDTLTRNLLASALLQREGATFEGYRNCRSAAEAYNRGIDETDADIIVFAHQDVYLPQHWESAFWRAIDTLEREDPDWAVIGVIGVGEDGTVVGRSWSSGLGRMVGDPLAEPAPVICVDELLIVLKRSSGLRFDENLPGFHLYGSDIVLTARAARLGAYVADLPVIHNSKPVRGLGGAYARAYRFMCRKWASILPVPTLIAPLALGPWKLWRVQFRLARSRGARLARSVDPDSDPRALARAAGLE